MGADTERYVFGKLSACYVQIRPFWHRHSSNYGDIGHGKSAQGGVLYTVVYGKHAHLTRTTPDGNVRTVFILIFYTKTRLAFHSRVVSTWYV